MRPLRRRQVPHGLRRGERVLRVFASRSGTCTFCAKGPVQDGQVHFQGQLRVERREAQQQARLGGILRLPRLGQAVHELPQWLVRQRRPEHAPHALLQVPVGKFTSGWVKDTPGWARVGKKNAAGEVGGLVYDGGHAECTTCGTCEAGTWRKQCVYNDGGFCAPCRKGSWKENGHAAPGHHSDKCFDCKCGKFGNTKIPTTSEQHCEQCSTGQYNTDEGRIDCEKCTACELGRFAVGGACDALSKGLKGTSTDTQWAELKCSPGRCENCAQGKYKDWASTPCRRTRLEGHVQELRGRQVRQCQHSRSRGEPLPGLQEGSVAETTRHRRAARAARSAPRASSTPCPTRTGERWLKTTGTCTKCALGRARAVARRRHLHRRAVEHACEGCTWNQQCSTCARGRSAETRGLASARAAARTAWTASGARAGHDWLCPVAEDSATGATSAPLAAGARAARIGTRVTQVLRAGYVQGCRQQKEPVAWDTRCGACTAGKFSQSVPRRARHARVASSRRMTARTAAQHAARATPAVPPRLRRARGQGWQHAFAARLQRHVRALQARLLQGGPRPGLVAARGQPPRAGHTVDEPDVRRRATRARLASSTAPTSAAPAISPRAPLARTASGRAAAQTECNTCGVPEGPVAQGLRGC